jgi:hypothetical protein
MVCRNLGEKYELFLLGALSREDAAEISEHVLRGCEDCLAHLREASLTIYLLAQSTRPVRPDPKLKSGLLKRLRGKQR